MDDLFGLEEHGAVEVSWGIYQQMIAAYRDAAHGMAAMESLIASLRHGVSTALTEVASSAGP